MTSLKRCAKPAQHIAKTFWSYRCRGYVLPFCYFVYSVYAPNNSDLFPFWVSELVCPRNIVLGLFDLLLNLMSREIEICLWLWNNLGVGNQSMLLGIWDTGKRDTFQNLHAKTDFSFPRKRITHISSVLCSNSSSSSKDISTVLWQFISIQTCTCYFNVAVPNGIPLINEMFLSKYCYGLYFSYCVELMTVEVITPQKSISPLLSMITHYSGAWCDVHRPVC